MAFNSSGASSGATAGAAMGSVVPGIGTAIGAIVGGLAGGFLSKSKAPKAAVLKPVDPLEEQRKAIESNFENADSIEALIARSNAFTQQQANGMMESAMPGYAKIAGKFMGQADNLLTDPYSLPKDVTSNLQRLAAERGVNTGVRGQAGEFSLLRDFGINSLQYGQSRISQAQSITQMLGSLAPKVNPMSPVSFYVTPQQAMGAAQGNNAGQFSANQAQNNAEAGAANANSSMWGSIVANLAGMTGGLMDGKGNPKKGVGGKTTYADFLKKNPTSSAAIGQ